MQDYFFFFSKSKNKKFYFNSFNKKKIKNNFKIIKIKLFIRKKNKQILNINRLLKINKLPNNFLSAKYFYKQYFIERLERYVTRFKDFFNKVLHGLNKLYKKKRKIKMAKIKAETRENCFNE